MPKEIDTAVIKLYHEWRSRYLVLNSLPDKGEAYIVSDRSGFPKKKDEVVSEGQGYGMVIMVLMAGVDKDEEAVFDKLYNYYKAHRCKSGRGDFIMIWKQVGGKDKDSDGAADGDLDIAYSLLLADKQWGSANSVNYKAEAISLLNDILKYYINPVAGIILNSNSVTSEDNTDGFSQWNAIRVSDFMPSHLRAFDKALPNPLWKKIITNTYSIFKNFQDTVSNTGLISDMIVNVNTIGQAAPFNYIHGKKKINLGTYNYNGCRLPWRIGIDVLLDSTKQGLDFLQKLNKFFRDKSRAEPSLIADGYSLAGKILHKKPDKYHLCYVAPLGVSAMIGTGYASQQWLDKIWQTLNAVSPNGYDKDGDFGYYDYTIRLYTEIIIAGHYWRL